MRWRILGEAARSVKPTRRGASATPARPRCASGPFRLTLARASFHTSLVSFRIALRALLILLAAGLFLLAVPGIGGAATPEAQAETLHRRANEQIDRNTIEGRREAMQLLEQATLLSPKRADLQIELGRLYYRMGFLKQARLRFEHASDLEPASAEAEMGLGEVWRRDYLKFLDRTSLARSLGHFGNAARLAPDSPAPWLRMAPLQL